ncbi:TonB-dependent receptor [Hymenobacter arizonensis]|uniref:Outer membrane receptor proteins, mostly Fe transport n=1 Tax=Hymenobacter arizonensis TaxID=1227077 RepID=A0A1I6B5W6_HYMAR|nr:TonB-dependent receptor [Hymenobacter arizonensis]SFQ76315.1 Outer membrane receptor proteins, mostly Fe transport [Hymenobacter arizonensis]
MKLFHVPGLQAGLGLSVALFFVSWSAAAQHVLSGRVFDAATKEPLVGATVRTPDSQTGTATNNSGFFTLATEAPQLVVSAVGYKAFTLTPTAGGQNLRVALEPAVEDLQTVVVTASREAQLRTDAPVAISKISPTVIQDTKPTLLVELINKVPGVVMLNYGNEQHAMGIRQPFGTNAYFLYLEDGLPLRPMGVFNHNALLETNPLAISSIEVVKGPASSLYGPEAVGGAINVLTKRPTSVPTLSVGAQGDQYGYRRVQLGGGGMLTPKLGVYVSGYLARQRNGWVASSDYDKQSVNGKLEYALSAKTRLTASASYNNYDSQTSSSVDSLSYYRREYSSTSDFTYRKTYALRSYLKAEHQWNPQHASSLTAYFRDNSVGQNPTYGIRWTSGAPTARGEVNVNAFKSYGLLAQHNVKFDWLGAKLLGGLMVDYSPTHYNAQQIDLAAQLRADGKSVTKYTVVADRPDKPIASYDTDLLNSAVYAQLDLHPLPTLPALQLTLGGRFDRLSFAYNNYLDNSTGSKVYQQATPKVGLTYDLGRGRGLYANYSQGFSPPGLTSIFRARPVPAGTPAGMPAEFYYNLKPARFFNREVGGWTSLLDNKVYVDVALYQLDGRNELLNIRQPDNSTDYQSAGKTLHRGVEYGLTYKPTAELFFRFGGTNAVHRFEEFVLSARSTDAVQNVNGKEMPQAPRWVANTELTYKPKWAPGLRAAAEYQRIGAWYQDQVNRVRYEDKGLFGARGVSMLNVRAGYSWRETLEVFANVLNLTNERFATAATQGNALTDRSTYTPGAPRTVALGVQYNFIGKK